MSFLTPIEDVVSYLGNALFLQGFGYVDKFSGISGIAGFVEIADRADAKNLVPASVFLEYFQHLFLLYHFFQLFRIGAVRHLEQKAVVIFHEVEQVDVSGAGQ